MGHYAGWIYKQGSLVKSWKKRYFILDGNRLSYYDTSLITSDTKPKGVLIVLSVETSTKIRNGLLVHGTGGRVMHMYTESSEEANVWLSKLKFLNQEDVSDDSEYASSSPMDNTLGNVHSGWLHKEGKHVKSWKLRYFVLKGMELVYYDSSEKNSTAKGGGKVSGVTVWKEKPNSLNIYFAKGRLLRVSADTLTDMTIWFEQLSLVVDEQIAADRNSTFVDNQVLERLSENSNYDLFGHKASSVRSENMKPRSDDFKRHSALSKQSSEFSETSNYDLFGQNVPTARSEFAKFHDDGSNEHAALSNRISELRLKMKKNESIKSYEIDDSDEYWTESNNSLHDNLWDKAKANEQSDDELDVWL